ncbi:hypothetical protein NW755_011826 [Fusarium falciforme]|uniref:Ricin B lectin domain-containing protein n=1 Tax=Fusarium falciforme TaxID=195108 RepID=A0A9W8QXN4_9HYPO|nr:hypothetical protein NW755_011826 [Fusarium falciforme]KAJ4247675.1 hypothetical protein NW757_008833 [Fusarium falciforme]
MSDLKPATKIDPNVWYQLTEAAVDDYEGDFVSSLQPVAQDDDLHVWPAKDINAFWQFQPIGDKPGRYAIRCSKTTTQKQLSVCYRPDVKVENRRTHACLLDSDGTDAQHWDVASWGANDTYRLINVKNGTDYYLDCVPNGPVFLSPNHEGYQSRQHWLMTSVKDVDDAAYSTVFSEDSSSTSHPMMTSASTSESTASESETSTSGTSEAESSSGDSSNNKGLSSGAIAGISIGATLAVVTIALLAFFLWRRRKQNAQNTNSVGSSESNNEGNDLPMPVSPVPAYNSTRPSEKLDSEPPSIQEMLHEQAPVELSAEQ